MNRQSDPNTPVVETASDGAVQPETLEPGRWRRVALAVASLLCFGGALAIYVLRLDRTVGMFVDDAWYVLLAKAIASGHGFTMINSPTPGILPLYPPGFPALLSIVFRFSPEFPQNVWMLKSVSIAAMMGVGMVTFWYFHRARRLPSYLSLAIAMATTITPPLVFLASSTVMSEPVFLLSSMLVIAFVERGVQLGDRGRLVRYVVPAAVFASYAFLTRSIAIALIGSVALYLLKERQVRAAVVFAAGVLICVAPWMFYSRLHAPTAEERAEQSGFIVQDYATQFWQRKAGLARAGEISASELPERVWNNASQMMTRDAGEMIVAKVFYIFQETDSGAAGLSFVFGLLCIAGYISAVREKLTLAEIAVPATLCIVLLWPWETFRFVLPLTAFALYYVLLGLRSIFHVHLRLREQPRRPEWVGLTVLAGMIIVLHLYGNVSYLVLKYRAPASEPTGLMSAFAENEEVLRFIKERLPVGGVIASPNPALTHLYTDRKTIASDDPTKNWQNWNRLGVRYLAYISALPVTQPELAETRYAVVYKPRGELNLRIVDLGPPDVRPVWGAALPRRMDMIN